MYKEFKPEGCNKTYLVYDDGRIFDVKLNKFKKPALHRKGYLKYSFYIDNKDKKIFAHRLILMLFNPVENMNELQVNHKDGNKQNNHLDNLEWVTQSENQKHAFSNGLISRKGENNSQAKLTEDEVLEIVDMLKSKEKVKYISEKFHISESAVYLIKNKKKWIYLTKDIDF